MLNRSIKKYQGFISLVINSIIDRHNHNYATKSILQSKKDMFAPNYLSF